MPTDAPEPPVTAAPASPWPARIDALRAGWIVYAALLALGLALYFGHDGSSTTPRFAAAPPDGPGPRDLARLDAGATLTASSYDLGGNLHPLFLIDGDASPPADLQWASAPRDRAPWLVLRLPRRADLTRAELTLAHPLPSAVTVTCLRGDVEVASPEPAPPPRNLRVALKCEDVDGVRFDLTPSDREAAVVRAAELEVFGTPRGAE